MVGEPLRGVASGALGTAALNVTTYLDVAVRGRPMSSTPQKDVEDLAHKAGVDLSAGGSEEAAANRSQALGTLAGYVTGLSMGGLYGLLRSHAPGIPRPLAAVAVGLGAMAVTDGVTMLLGNTDPTEWSGQAWAADVVPHLIYGGVTVAAYDSFRE